MANRRMVAGVVAGLATIFVGGCASSQRDRQTAGQQQGGGSVDRNLDEVNVVGVLNDLHDAAAKADGKRYFDHFAEESVFLGTDASERWSKKEFEAYANPYFSKGKGWTYVAYDRHVTISHDGATAWFDEKLTNASYGDCRGSGVLVKVGDVKQADGGWKIAQYNLTVPVPNELMKDVAGMIRERGSSGQR